MSRELLILRHAKSAWASEAPTDFERPLAKRGFRDAPRMGAWLRGQQLIPDHIVSSPAVRAKQTAAGVLEGLGMAASSTIHWQPRIYEASLGALLAILEACPVAAARVLIIGHNPGLEYLLAYLADKIPNPDDGKLLPTATLAHLAMPDQWENLQAGCASLAAITRPRSLPDKDD